MGKEIVELLRDRAIAGRMKVRDKQLILYAADELEKADIASKMFKALESIIWYDGHYEWLKTMRDNMETLLKTGDKYVNYSFPFDTTEWHTEAHTIYMILVGMFGDWGTSIRSGWIENIEECIGFIDTVCKSSWEEDAERKRKDGAE